MADEEQGSKSSGTVWLLIAIVSVLVLVTGPAAGWIISPWIAAVAFIVAVIMYIRARGRATPR